MEVNTMADYMNQISEQLADLQRCMGSVEAKIDDAVDNRKRLEGRIDGHERRIAKTENKIHWWSGIAAACGAGLGFVTNYIFKGA